LTRDLDIEIITDAVVTPDKPGDTKVAEDLIPNLLEGAPVSLDEGTETPSSHDEVINSKNVSDSDAHNQDAPPSTYGDNADGTGEFQSSLSRWVSALGLRSRGLTLPTGFTTEHFVVDRKGDAITYLAGVTVSIRCS
jgi:hypothetical protein